MRLATENRLPVSANLSSPDSARSVCFQRLAGGGAPTQTNEGRGRFVTKWSTGYLRNSSTVSVTATSRVWVLENARLNAVMCEVPSSQ